jgi:transposase InsO family protein
MPWHTTDTMNQRTQFALRALQTDNFRALCREYGISAKTGYKWKKNFLAEGKAGLCDASKRPQSSPKALGEEEIFRIVSLHNAHRFWGPRKLRDIYERSWGCAPSESSFKRVLRRCGLSHERLKRPAKVPGGRIHHGRRASECNEVWSVDFKGWWNDGAGRSNPLTVRDEFSRFVLELRHLPDGRTETVQDIFAELFANYGLPQAIRSDNGPPFASANGLLGLSRLSAWWLALGIELERSRPGCPQDNGAHERMHKDIAREIQALSSSRAVREPAQRQAIFDVWREEFNTLRPHEALGMKRPSEVYEKSTRKWEQPEPELEYEGMETRKVSSSGKIKYGMVIYPVSTALRERHVGLKTLSEGRLEVYFAKVLLGHLDERNESFQAIEAASERPPEKTNIAPAQAKEPSASQTQGGAPLGSAAPHQGSLPPVSAITHLTV